MYSLNSLGDGLYYQVKRFLKYHGVTYTPFSARYLWLYVQYYDSSRGYVRVSSSCFNANVPLQRRLESVVPRGDWKWLQEKHGFKIGMASSKSWYSV